MTCRRLWIALSLAGLALSSTVRAQQSSGGGGSSGSGGGSATGAGSGASGGTSSSGSAPSGGSAGSGTGAGSSAGSQAPADTGAASSFGTPASGVPATPEPAAGAGTGGTGGGGAPAPSERAAQYSVPTGFGKPPETLTAGQGRLARPRFRFTGSVAIGFDDNVFGTPTNQQEIPDQVVQVVVQPERTVLVPDGFDIDFKGGIRTVVPRFREERQPAIIEEVVIPGGETAPREASIVERANVGLDVQFATRRTLLTLDLRLGVEHVHARDKDPMQYFGSMGMRFSHKLAPRLKWDASIDAAYSSQPDISRLNTPTTVTTGAYLNFVSRTGLSYRWTPRITTSAAVSYSGLTFSDATEESGDYHDITYSVEGSYLFSPRFTLLAEGRYSTISYANNLARDSSTTFLLVGADWRILPRLTSAFRGGVAVRESDAGDTAASPYLELYLTYRLQRASALQYNLRYGFEEPGDSTSKVVTLRNGLSYIQYLTPRLRAVAGANFLYSTTTSSLNAQDVTQFVFDTNLGMEYNINRRWTFTGTYSFTTVFSDNEFQEYYRNRLFLGFEYAF